MTPQTRCPARLPGGYRCKHPDGVDHEGPHVCRNVLWSEPAAPHQTKRLSRTGKRVLEYLEQHPNEANVSLIAEATETDWKTARAYLTKWQAKQAGHEINEEAAEEPEEESEVGVGEVPEYEDDSEGPQRKTNGKADGKAVRKSAASGENGEENGEEDGEETAKIKRKKETHPLDDFLFGEEETEETPERKPPAKKEEKPAKEKRKGFFARGLEDLEESLWGEVAERKPPR